MEERERTWRVGITVVLLALAFRLGEAGAPGTIAAWLEEKGIWPPGIEEETGRDVRFSPSLGEFFPDFVESPPAFSQAIPAFSGEEAVEVYYGAKKDPDLPALLAQPLSWELKQEKPTVLILHTHTTESYTKQGEDYTESSAWRTLDEGYNMLSIGDTVARCLEEEGIHVIQDREFHDYPSYNGSYTHARKGIRACLEENPGILLVLDLHRDASGGDGGQLRTLARVEGEPSAQLMVVVGTNHEGYEENLSLGLKLHSLLEQAHPGLMRPLQLRSQRFNQDLSPGSLLVEVGAAGNSHAEAQTAAKALASAIVALAKGSE